MINRILHDLQREGLSISPEAVAALSPYLTKHIDRFGRYEIDVLREAAPLMYELPDGLSSAVADVHAPNTATSALETATV